MINKLPILELAIEMKNSIKNRKRKDNKEISTEQYIANERYSLVNLSLIAIKTASIVYGSATIYNTINNTLLDKSIILAMSSSFLITQLIQIKKEKILKREALETKFVQNLLLKNFSQKEFNNFNDLSCESNYRFFHKMNLLRNGDTLENWLFKILKYNTVLQGKLTQNSIKLIHKLERFCKDKLEAFIKTDDFSLIQNIESILELKIYNRQRYDLIETHSINKNDIKDNIFAEIASNIDNYKENEEKIKVLIKNANEQAISYAYEKTNTQNIYLLLAKAVHDNNSGKKNDLLLEYLSKLHNYTTIENPQNISKKYMASFQKENTKFKKVSEIAQSILNNDNIISYDFFSVLKELDINMVDEDKKTVKIISFQSRFEEKKQQLINYEYNKYFGESINIKKTQVNEIEFNLDKLDNIATIKNNPNLEKHLKKENKRTA